jgi:predicted dehydrogenase
VISWEEAAGEIIREGYRPASSAADGSALPRQVAARHPSVEWIGLAEKNPNRAGEVAPRIEADFVTGDHRELLKRPEVTAAIICTDEHLHVDPIMAGVEAGVPMLIEKPLATDLAQSARVLKAIEAAGLDAVVGYTQRFRRRWLAAKEKCRTGALGDITLVTSRAFMNRLVAIATTSAWMIHRLSRRW